MNSIEEKLWNYIDGTCTPEEHAQITQLILHDEEYKRLYGELLQLNNEFKTIELDEPPMAFTYNVMEQIRTEEAGVPLKSAINKKIIWAITGFFVLSILALLILAVSEVKWNSGAATLHIPNQLRAIELKGYFTGPWLQGFLFFDMILGLFLLDAYLRKRGYGRQSPNI